MFKKKCNHFVSTFLNRDISIISDGNSKGILLSKTWVIISTDEMNKYLQTIVIAPMTGNSKPYPTRGEVKSNKIKSWVVLDQIRTIDRQLVVKLFSTLSEKEIIKIKSVFQEAFVDEKVNSASLQG